MHVQYFIWKLINNFEETIHCGQRETLCCQTWQIKEELCCCVSDVTRVDEFIHNVCYAWAPHTHPSLMVSLFITLQRASYKVPQFIYLVSLFHFVKLESKKWDSVIREDFLVYFTFVRLHVKPQTLRQLALSTTFLPFSAMCQVYKSSWLTDNLCREHRWRVNWNINMMIGALTAPSRRGKV